MNDSWRRRKAEEKIAEWSVERGSFVAALEKLVSEKRLAGEWKFNRDEEVALAIEGAKRFFDEFSCKLVELSDGRYVYFAPDDRSWVRNHDNATCWAEYAFHAVSNGGARLPGKAYNERWYHPHKIANFDRIDKTLKAERCFVRLRKNNLVESSILFYGDVAAGILIQVITRLDQFGNVDANLTEVTFEASTGKVKKLPRLVPLAEAVQTVVHYQTTAGSYPPDKDNISNFENACKGAGSGCSDIAVIILIGQEKIHLKRCVEKLAPLNPRQIFLVESQPDDGGVAIAKETAERLGLRLETMYNKWPGLYARQFNWALENLPIQTKWVLRLDADEYLTSETIERLRGAQGLCALPDDVAGLTLELKRRFGGGEIRHATNGIRLLRIWRRGRGRSEERAMDEHIAIDGISDLDELRMSGKVIDFDGAFYDDNLNDMDWWRNKHRGYAKREAADALAFARGEIRFKSIKEKYYRLPPYFRAVMYFCIRYFLKGGFLDGKAGWSWNFWQGLWYRWLVDREIGKLKRARG